MRLVAYCRVSTDKDEQLESLANQQEFFEKYAARNNHELLKIYSDEGISGKQMKNRTAFLQLMNDAKLGLFDMVVVKDISRFARNTVDFLLSIRELKSLNIEVQFVSINQTVLGNSEFVLTMFSALAQEESANLSTRVKFGKKVNAKHGKVPNSIYGYDRIDRFNLKINPEQAQVVKSIFHMYTKEGLGTRRIAIKLTENNIPTMKSVGKWTPKTIRRMLSNSIYKGILITKKSEGVNFLTGERRKFEDTNGEFTFNKPELAIVSKKTFDEAETIMNQRKEQYKNKTPNNRVSTQYPFSSLMICETCGHSFTRRIAKLKRGDVVRWMCGGKNNNNVNYCTNTIVIDEEELLSEIRSYLYSKIKNKNKFIKDYEDSKQSIRSDKKDTKNIVAEINKLQNKKNKYMEMYINEIIDMSALKKYNTDTDKEINLLQKQLVDCQKPNISPKLTAEELYGHILNVLHGDTTNTALKKIIEKITINSNGEVKIVWK